MDPFDDPHAEIRVVIDSHGYPCLWPAAYPVPFGWITALCPAPRHEAQMYMDSHTSAPSLEEDARLSMQ